jgi:hypothetical protein
VVAIDPAGAHAAIYRGVARTIMQRLAGGGAARAFPKIVIE